MPKYSPAKNYKKTTIVRPTAILVDGAFFLKRYRHCFGKHHDPKTVVQNMRKMLMQHVDDERLYRILYYDCLPLSKKVHNPVTKRSVDFKKTSVYQFKYEFYTELKKQRKVAIRMGILKDNNEWIIHPSKVKDLLNNKINISDLTEKDVSFNVTQKGVDIKIGLDIASLAYKKLVSKIILVSGDSDFVPAAKLARREGIDFILDPMWQKIDDQLFEHIDGLKSTCSKPKNI